MDKEQKNMFYRNIVKFIVGIVLLTISYGYIQNHPAEKVSILSGFQVMYERGQIFVYGLLGQDTSVLKQKHNLEQYYQEIIRVAESRSCVGADLLSDIMQTYLSFSQSDIQTLSVNIQDYVVKASVFDARIQEVCP